MNYLPFDLEKALKNPERVVTVDGKEVNGFRDAREYGYEGDWPLDGFTDGNHSAWSIHEANENLRLKPETVEVTVYVYWDESENKPFVSIEAPPIPYGTHIDTQTITVNKP